MVITGDVTQIDLPAGRKSGLVEALEVLKSVEGIGITYLTHRDVVRHEVVQAIVKAYEKFDKRKVSHGMQEVRRGGGSTVRRARKARPGATRCGCLR